MATYPPPPGRPTAESVRAARRAARAQQRLVREQARALRRRSILGPLLVLALGTAFLLVQLGRFTSVQVVTWYSRWWPLILIVGGVVLLAEWVWDEATSRHVPPGTQGYARRGVGAGIVLLLVLLGLAGSALQHVSQHDLTNLHSGLLADRWTDWLGDPHEKTDHLDLPLPTGASLLVEVPHGDVTVSGSSSDGQAHLEIHKRVRSVSDDDATRQFALLTPSSNMEGGVLRLSVPSIDKGSSDLTLSVPASTAVSINSPHGEVRASDLMAAVQITANHGDVEVSNIHGNVAVQLNRRSSSFSAQDVHGSLQLDGTARDLSLSDISGQVMLNGEFYGDSHLQQLEGPLHFHTSRTDILVAAVPGSLDVSSHAGLDAAGLVGPLTLSTRSRDLQLRHVQGDAAISNRNGSITVETDSPVGNLSVNNQNGPITLTLPASASAALQAQTTNSRVTSEFVSQSASNGNGSTLRSQLGSGTAAIKLQTTNAQIAIKKAE